MGCGTKLPTSSSGLTLISSIKVSLKGVKNSQIMALYSSINGWNTMLGLDVFTIVSELPTLKISTSDADYESDETIGFYDPDLKEIQIRSTLSDKDLPRVAYHELGHSMGLGHVNEDNSIMNPYLTDDMPMVPSVNDIKRAKKLIMGIK